MQGLRYIGIVPHFFENLFFKKGALLKHFPKTLSVDAPALNASKNQISNSAYACIHFFSKEMEYIKDWY